MATGIASAYRVKFGQEYFGMALLPQVGTGLVVLGTDDVGHTSGLTVEQAQEVKKKLIITKWSTNL